jgi:hypothetical protein
MEALMIGFQVCLKGKRTEELDCDLLRKVHLVLAKERLKKMTRKHSAAY